MVTNSSCAHLIKTSFTILSLLTGLQGSNHGETAIGNGGGVNMWYVSVMSDGLSYAALAAGEVGSSGVTSSGAEA